MDRLCKIRDIYRSIMRIENAIISEYGLCLNEAILLCVLSRQDKLISSGEIAEALGLTSSNASKVIRTVESKGFIRRELGDYDKRQMYFSLTDTGTRKLKSMDFEGIEIPDMIKSYF